MAAKNFWALFMISLAVIAAVASVAGAQAAPARGDAAAVDLEPQWLWGEVVSVNAQSKTIQVKYLDYDTDIEKELVLTVDGQTKYENAKGLDDIKPQDTISVDYMVSADGVNLAVAISLEKLEDMDASLEDIELPERERVGAGPQKTASSGAGEESPDAGKSGLGK
ncbi:MAG TPA: hypothetical protein PLJ26_03715 [Candidatus Omnitrophota bacterium]|nr:hypothetical protein [Candidatus Omnitrophota bacterium]